MLDAQLRDQLQGLLVHLRHPIRLHLLLDEREASAELRALAEDIAALSDKVAVVVDDPAQAEPGTRRPQLRIAAAGDGAADSGVRFAALPLGHEFSSLVLALLQTGGHPPKVDAATLERIRALDGGPWQFETFMNLSCHNCPDVVQALNLMAIVNPRQVRHVAVDGSLFTDEVEQRGIMAVPQVLLNGTPFGAGRMSLEEILDKLDAHRGVKPTAATLPPPEPAAPYDVLIVGGGPAGGAAALYAARKGVRCGIVVERFGGQTQDTLGIENFPSVAYTEGPQFAAAIERQVRAHEVEVLQGRRAIALEAPARAGELAKLVLDNGRELAARTVVIATGARWRTLDVPGEAEYKNRGVAYCPHCDGPLFKGKKVAVVGGGNSGVEAAIDLAGLAAEVTLLEFAAQLRADAVLVAKLKSLPNVRVLTQAQTTEIAGDSSKVKALRYKDRSDGSIHELALDGVFVQIGLVPNSEWLRGTLELNRYGEIVVDARGATSAPGVFAAGDVTTVPYKQIVIAAGEGAKAALSAFDLLIRSPSAAEAAVAG
jgi:alkyl hydroperoxide reductase subunit F